ncbi:MAG: DUF475 domain-containing protein, partial [Proteobacteria bacterium]
LVLAVLARDLPKQEQKKALTYGLAGAFVFRFIALALVTYLVKWQWVKFVGGGYLIYLSANHLLFNKKGDEEEGRVSKQKRGFWATVALIELTDVAFALDSILAAVALTQKLWVIYLGGIMGIILMRVAAGFFIKMLDKFPRLEQTAYMLVFIIGTKVILEASKLGLDFHSVSSPAFWVFWALMLVCIIYGVLPKGEKKLTAK